MINPGLNKYDVILADKHYLRELVESITLDDSIDEIAYRGTIQMVVTGDFPGISPGQAIRVSGVPFGGSKMAYLLHPAVVWDINSVLRGQKRLTAVTYDPSIYMARSEDEYLFPAGQTAAQRLEKYASDWEIPLAKVEDTGIQLSKAVYRAQPIYNMLMSDLRETVSKGGSVFLPRMTPGGLSLIKLGSNKTVWALETGQSVEEVSQRRTMEGAVTQVKVLGAAEKEGRSPVLALEKGETEGLGTLQRVLQDPDITSTGAAKKAASEMLAGVQQTISVSGIDINTIRAGDKVQLDGWNLFVFSVRHELGSPGHMSLELADEAYIRRSFYGRPF